jgi:hypothetical protein
MLTVPGIFHEWYALIAIEVDRGVVSDMSKVLAVLVTFATFVNWLTLNESNTALSLPFSGRALFIAVRGSTHFFFNFGSDATVLTAISPVILLD